MLLQKRCNGCGDTKPLTEYYASPGRSKDGLNARCKTCIRAAVKQYQQANRERVLENARVHGRRRRTLARRLTCEEVRVRQNARLFINRELRAGRMVCPEACESCKQSHSVTAHHPDYNERGVVEWLCKTCHRAADKKQREQERGVATAIALMPYRSEQRPQEQLLARDRGIW